MDRLQGESEAFEAAGRMESQSLAERAKQLFDDPEFTELCASSLNAQLQRTKDGATDKSRITELAGKPFLHSSISNGS